ncbi:MAG: SIR2 family protein [Sulfuricella sp.]|nr:SIR2 family protein [Sulfuricella sp.]
MQLPIGNQLANEISNKFSLPNNYRLTQLAGAVEPKEKLSDFLFERFSGCEAAVRTRLISHFVWSSIYTFNIDDVLNDCYLKTPKFQNPNFLTFRDPFQTPEDPDELPIIHLHGSVKKRDHGFVFSSEEYGDTSSGGYTWFPVLSDELISKPFIIIGCTLDEPDLEACLATRKGLTPETRQIAPSLFVTKVVDAVVIALCNRFGLIPIEAESETFLAYLDGLVTDRKGPIDLLLDGDNLRRKLTTILDDKTTRVFFRQWTYIEEDTLPTPLEPLHLLNGTEPTWYSIKNNEDVIRTTERLLIKDIQEYISNTSSNAPEIWEINSAAGEGKSTALLRVGLELARLKYTVFHYSANERLVEDAATNVLSSMSDTPILLVDNLDEHAPQIAQLIDGLKAKGKRCILLGALRRSRLDYFESVCSDAQVTRVDLQALTQPESLTLAGELRRLGRLGANAGLGDAELAQRMAAKQLISAIVEAGGAIGQFNTVIRSEYEKLNADAKKIYCCVAFAHSVGEPVKVAVVTRASNISTALFFKTLHNDLKGIVRYASTEYLVTRHRIVSEHVIQKLNEDERFEHLLGLERALSPYVNRKTIMRGTPESGLAARLMNYDRCVRQMLPSRAEEFFEKAQPENAWNSRYWEQRALMSLDTNIEQAKIWAQHAVGIEEHPHTLTTYAKVLFCAAEKSTNYSDVEHYTYEALDVVDRAIAASSNRRRMEIHPFDVAVRGLGNSIRNHKTICQRKFPEKIAQHVAALLNQAEQQFGQNRIRYLRQISNTF